MTGTARSVPACWKRQPALRPMKLGDRLCYGRHLQVAVGDYNDMVCAYVSALRHTSAVGSMSPPRRAVAGADK